MPRCSKCIYGNLVKVSETGINDIDWMIECNAFDEPDYLELSHAELDEMPCDLYVEYNIPNNTAKKP